MQLVSIANTTVSATGPLASVSTSGLSGADPTIMMAVVSLSGGSNPQARVGVEDTTDGTRWTPVAVWHFSGNVTSPAPAASSKRGYLACTLAMGGVNTAVRVNVYQLSAGATLQLQSSL